MDNYSVLEKWLHKVALSYQMVRETTYDLENFFHKQKEYKDNHIFVFGLARSGSTALLNAIYQSEEFASLSYKDMPFVLAPNLWASISLPSMDSGLKERAHGDGIKISVKSPEAFEEVFWATFKRDSDKEIRIKFKSFISQVISKERKHRYLSKNNQNVKRSEILDVIFPKSKKLVTFRNPLQQAFSLLTQHKNFINLAKSNQFVADYMKWIGHTEFGPNYSQIETNSIKFNNCNDINHWLEQWYLVYGMLEVSLKKKSKFRFICYEKLCLEPNSWKNIQNFVNIEKDNTFLFQESCKDTNVCANNTLLEKCYRLYDKLKAVSL